jgi:hypothetical protein
MTTIHDFSNADGEENSSTISLDKFMAARTSRRSAEAALLASMRNAFAVKMERTRADHVARAERLFSDTALSRLERESLLRTHRETMKADVDAIRLERDKTVGRDHSSSRLGRWINDRTLTHGDRQDYLHVLKSAYEDGGLEFDPVLLAIPRSRRRREGAMAVYSVRDGHVDREIFRVLPDTNEVVMRSTDERALEAAVVKAHHDFGPPLSFTSKNPVFIARCTSIAERYGFQVAEAQGNENATPAAAQQPSGPQGAPGATEPRRESGVDSPVKVTPDVSLESHDAFKASLTESYGLDHFMTLGPESKLTLRGRFIGAEDHPDNTNYYVAAVETAAGMTLVAVDRQLLASIETDTDVTLRGIDGKWEVEGQAQSTDTPATPEQSSDEHRGRGR